MADFKPFSAAVRTRFTEMSQEPLFVVNSDRDAIWARYLRSFPPGTDPLYRTKTEHDCSCCRAFIRNVGNVVAIQNGALSTVWDLAGLPEPYQSVADAMSAYIKGLDIANIFLTEFPHIGAEVSRELHESQVITYDHFFLHTPKKYVTRDGDAQRGQQRTNQAVFLRGLTEIDPEALTTILELIDDKNAPLYRGAEYKPAVLAFQQLQQRFLALPEGKDRTLFTWANLHNRAALFNSSVIASLAEDLTNDIDIDAAVRKFEAKVDPTRIHRSTSVITSGMIKKAMTTIAELNIEPSLQRRHARFEDVSVNSVLFVDNSVRGKMRDAGGLADLLMQEVKPVKFDPTHAEEISIDHFIDKVLPKTTSLKLWLTNALTPNFVSLTAPVNQGVEPIFKWDNNFAWSYAGNVTDSIKDRVKRAGGTVEGVAMRVSLGWENLDDLDLHVREPNGNWINFRTPGNKNGADGYLDVDMNVSNPVRGAVENVRWKNPPRDGNYHVAVNNYTRRENINVGFTIEIESAGVLQTLRYEKPVQSQATIDVALIAVRRGAIEKIVPAKGITGGAASHDQWGLKTESLIQVDSVVLSPNYWDDNAVGNKHFIFILEGCLNPEPTRGIFNEYLNSKLHPHRKVFEVLADKTKCPVVDQQMSGVGFSSTRKDKVTVTAMGPSLNKSYTIAF